MFETTQEHQNLKLFLQKVTLQVGPRKFLILKMLKTLCCGHISSMILTETFLQRRVAKNKSKRIWIEKVIKRKGDKPYAK